MSMYPPLTSHSVDIDCFGTMRNDSDSFNDLGLICGSSRFLFHPAGVLWHCLVQLNFRSETLFSLGTRNAGAHVKFQVSRRKAAK